MSELILEISDFEKEIELIMSGEKGLSYSACSAFLKSPKHFYEYKTGVQETTPAMKEGKMFHMACLELDKFKELYWVLDDSDKCLEIGGAKPRSTNKYKDWLELQDLLHKGQERVSQQDYDTYINMSNALRRNKAAGILMNNLTDTEKGFSTIIDGFKFTGKVDGVGEIKTNIEDNLIDLVKGDKYQIDLKKVADASYQKIRWDITNMNYHLQGGLYSSVNKISKYFLVYIDKACNITIVKLDETILSEGYQKLETALAEFTRCAEENLWHSSYEFFNGGYIVYTSKI